LDLWGTIVSGFSSLIQYLYEWTVTLGLPSYGLAIIMITILVKVALFPLTNSQMKSMRGMQELQPKLKQLQERYKDDPQKMQAQVMGLYKENGVSPFSSCLPLLIQMPILIAFYQALYKMEFTNTAHAAFLWISNLANKGTEEGLFGLLLPILAAATTYYQQRISTVDPNDPTQKMMLITMPLFIGYMAYTFQAGLALYWVAFNVLSIIQQVWVNKKYGRPGAALKVASEGSAAESVILQDDKGTAKSKGGSSKQHGNSGEKKGKNR